jgi:hypothetical protein
MIKVTINTLGSIEIQGLARKQPSHVEADQVMRQLSTALGEGWGTVKLSGIWLVGRTDGEYAPWTPIWGHLPGQQSRSFDKVLANATGRAVVTTVSF